MPYPIFVDNPWSEGVLPPRVAGSALGVSDTARIAVAELPELPRAARRRPELPSRPPSCPEITGFRKSGYVLLTACRGMRNAVFTWSIAN